jgi:FkbM family methyltransferase
MNTTTMAQVDFLGKQYRFATYGAQDHVSRILLSGAMYEAPLLEYLASFDWPQGSIALDVGAYLGTHSSVFAKQLGLVPWAFEPNRRSYSLAMKSLEANIRPMGKGKAYRLFLAPVGPQGESFSLRSPSGGANYGNTECVPDPDGRLRSYSCSMLMQELPKGKHVCLVKIDAESMSLPVLRELMPLIQQDMPFLCVEGTRPEIDPLLPWDYVWGGQFGATPMQVYIPTAWGR